MQRSVLLSVILVLVAKVLMAAEGPPGVVIAYSPAASKQYVGSPSLAVLPGGDYVASHDFFGPNSGWNRTRVYRSKDRGQTWTQQAELEGQWWSTTFVHREALYILGTSREYGHVVIRRSTDGGTTWTTPKDKQTGLLRDDGKFHCAPVPVVIHNGRLWRAMEDAEGLGGWGTHFRAFMMSIPEEADLLQAANWTSSNPLERDPKWLDGKFGGWLEGNAVVTPAGKIVDILRVDHRPVGNYAAIVEISDDGKTATFDPAKGFITFPGGSKKFTIRWDPQSKHYWTLSNVVREENKGGPNSAKVRNTLALMRSPDLIRWEIRRELLHHPDVEKHGFQYVDWLFDGNDLIAACRTAYDDGQGGAHNQHDANYLTFHRFAEFRTAVKPPATKTR